jgi:hypothetical protein
MPKQIHQAQKIKNSSKFNIKKKEKKIMCCNFPQYQNHLKKVELTPKLETNKIKIITKFDLCNT